MIRVIIFKYLLQLNKLNLFNLLTNQLMSLSKLTNVHPTIATTPNIIIATSIILFDVL